MFHAAFYKAVKPGIPGVYNRIVQGFEQGPYSHCEAVFSDGVAASASFMDRGVRFVGEGLQEKINFHSGKWDLIRLPDELEAPCRRHFRNREGKSYDLRGNLRFVLPWGNRDSKDKDFCIEILLESVGIKEGWRYGVNMGAMLLGLVSQGVDPASIAYPQRSPHA